LCDVQPTGNEKRAEIVPPGIPDKLSTFRKITTRKRDYKQFMLKNDEKRLIEYWWV